MPTEPICFLSLIEGRLTRFGARLAGIEARLTMLTWMMALQAAVTVALSAGTFAVWARLP